MINPIVVKRNDYASKDLEAQACEEELKPYLSLFVKPMTSKKSKFSKPELARMCKDPLHSPRLICYLIEFVKTM